MEKICTNNAALIIRLNIATLSNDMEGTKDNDHNYHDRRMLGFEQKLKENKDTIMGEVPCPIAAHH